MAQNHSGTRIHSAQAEEPNPRSRWQTVGRGGATIAAEPLLIQKKKRNPQSGWQKTWLFINNMASPFINGNTIFLQENLKLFLHGILAVMLLLIDNIVNNCCLI